MNYLEDENVKRDLRWTMGLTCFEGIVFFIAGICALMTATILGYISGGLLIALACANLFPVFFHGGKYFLNLGISIAEDEDADTYGRRLEEEKANENAEA